METPHVAQMNQLASEIRDLHTQYLCEVPKARGQWPSSIRTRVCELRNLGVSYKELMSLTGIPAQTMYKWKLPSVSSFKEISVIDTKPAVEKTSAQASEIISDNLPVLSPPAILTVTMIMPNGVRLEGLDQESALKLARGLMR